MFRESTVNAKAKPGNKDTHQAVEIYDLPSATIRPQVGVGGGIPAPKKLNVASVRII
jgi:hypothetical protein